MRTEAERLFEELLELLRQEEALAEERDYEGMERLLPLLRERVELLVKGQGDGLSEVERERIEEMAAVLERCRRTLEGRCHEVKGRLRDLCEGMRGLKGYVQTKGPLPRFVDRWVR